jgi:hypothetical protein
MARLSTEATAIATEEDFGLTRDVPHADRWINPEGGAAVTRAQLEGWKRAFFSDAATLKRVRDGAEATIGELVHNLGTGLREIRGRSAWKILGIASWEEYCTLELKISKRHADRIVAFAGAVTRTQAAFGIRKCFAGLAIADRLGLKGLGNLVPPHGEQEPEAWAKAFGEPVAFEDSSALRLERLVAPPKPPALPAKSTPRRVKTVVDERKVTIAAVTERHPVLARLEVRSYAKDGQPRVNQKPASTREELLALAAMYTALAKKA